MPAKIETILDETVISSDAGNGWAACYRVSSGKVRQHGIPHARMRVTGTKLNTDIGTQNIADYADFMGQRYGYGEGIWNITDTPIDMHQNTSRRYGGNMHIFLMFVNIACMNVKSGTELTLIVPAPPGMFNEVSPQLKKSLLAGEDGDGIWRIQLRTDKKPREYKIVRVITVPEGAGAFAAFSFSLNGEAANLKQYAGADVLAGRVTVLDLGAGTGDSFTIYNGNVNPDNMIYATDDKAGVIHNLLKPILSEVLQAVPEAKFLTTAHIDSYLRRYVANPSPENATIRVSGKLVNIERSILANCERYAQWIASNKIDPLWASGSDAIIEAGGGWIYIESFIRQWYPERIILTPSMFPHTKQIALYDLNGVGQLHLAAAVFRQQQP